MIFVPAFLITLGGIAMVRSKQTNPHGGVIKAADGYFIEMKNAGKNFQVYLLNKKLEPLGTKNIIGEVRFFFPDSTDIDINLKPYGENAFMCMAPPGYYACKVSFNIMGKSISAKFQAQNMIVLKE